MVAIHAFDSLNVSLGASVVYHETRNASNCIKKPDGAVRGQARMNGGQRWDLNEPDTNLGYVSSSLWRLRSIAVAQVNTRARML